MQNYLRENSILIIVTFKSEESCENCNEKNKIDPQDTDIKHLTRYWRGTEGGNKFPKVYVF